MAAAMRFEVGLIRDGGSWRDPGPHFGRFQARLGGSWGGLGGCWDVFWTVGGATRR